MYKNKLQKERNCYKCKKNQTKFQHVMEIIVRRMNCRHDQSEWKKSEAGWATNL